MAVAGKRTGTNALLWQTLPKTPAAAITFGWIRRMLRLLVFVLAFLDWIEESYGFGQVLGGARHRSSACARVSGSTRMLDVAVQPDAPDKPNMGQEQLPEYMKCAPPDPTKSAQFLSDGLCGWQVQAAHVPAQVRGYGPD